MLLSKNMARKFQSSDSPEERWYYLEPGQVQPAGPVGVSDLRELLEKKKVHKKSIVWRKGMNQWEGIENVPQLRPQRSFFSLARFGFGKKPESEETARAAVEPEEIP